MQVKASQYVPVSALGSWRFLKRHSVDALFDCGRLQPGDSN